MFQKNKIYIILLWMLLALFLLTFFISKLIFIYILIFLIPGLIISRFLPSENFNRLDKIILAPVFGFALISLIGIIYSVFNIKIDAQNLTIIYIIIFIFGFLSWIKTSLLIRDKSQNFDFKKFIKIRWPYFVATFIFLLFAFAKIFPTLGIEAPMGMDPVAHGMWTKKIIELGKVNYFYSPGFHLSIAFSNLLSGVSIGKQLLYLTNFFNAYISLVVFILFYKIFNRGIVALITSFLSAIAMYPAMFYQSAGKNALTCAIPLLIVGILFSYLTWKSYEKDGNLKYIIFSNFIFYTLGIVHYPTVFILFLFNLAIIFEILISKDKDKKLRIFNFIWSFAPALLIISAWALTHFSGSYDSQIANNFNQSISIISGLKSLKGSLVEIFNLHQISLEYFYPIIASFLTLNLLILLKSKFRIFVFWQILISSIWFFVEAFHISSADIVTKTMIAIYFFLILPLLAIFIDFLVRKIKWPNLALILTIIIILSSFVQARKVYKSYLNYQNDGSIVTSKDLQAYKFINENIPKDKLIFNNSIKGSRNIIFGLDGGTWMPVYTENSVAMPFFEMAKKDIKENYSLFDEVLKNPQDSKLISKIKTKNINYIYIGQKSVADHKIDFKLFENSYYKKIYQNDQIYIYEIL